MADLNAFNAHEVEPSTSFDPVPAGEYLAIIIDSAMKATKSANGHYLELQFQIVEGEYAKRHLWERLNLDNPNAQAVQIARAHLSAICRAVGVMTPADSCNLHDLPLMIRVKRTKRKDNGEMTNEITAYEKTVSTPPMGLSDEDLPL